MPLVCMWSGTATSLDWESGQIFWRSSRCPLASVDALDVLTVLVPASKVYDGRT